MAKKYLSGDLDINKEGIAVKGESDKLNYKLKFGRIDQELNYNFHDSKEMKNRRGQDMFSGNNLRIKEPVFGFFGKIEW